MEELTQAHEEQQMARHTLLFLPVLAFISCASPYDLKKTKPLISFETSKSVEEVKKCIYKKWSSHISVIEEKTHTGYLLRHNDVLPAATIAIVTIEPNETQTVVQHHNQSKKIPIHRLEEEVMGCK